MSKNKLRDRLRKKQEELAKKGEGGGSFIFFKEGILRARPVYCGEDKEFAVEAIYFYLGPEIKGVVSPATWGDKCAIMKKYLALKNSGDEDDKELSKSFSIKRRYFSPHIKYLDLKGKKIDHEAGVKLACLTNGQYDGLIELFLDDEQGDFTHPKEGYDIKYKRTGSGMYDTVYSLVPCKPTKLDKKYVKKIYDPEEMLRKETPSYKETKKYLKQFLNEEVSSKKKKKKKKSKDL